MSTVHPSGTRVLSAAWLVAVTGFVLAFGGCTPAGAPVATGDYAGHGRPEWNETSARRHERALSSSPVPGRTPTMHERTTYVAERLAQYGIQPLLDGEFRYLAAQGSPRAVNIAGYIPGRHPVRSSDLVVLGCLLRPVAAAGTADATADRAETRDRFTADRPAAALLEAARMLAALAHEGRGPDRTVLVIFWSGDDLGAPGWDAWLENTGWPHDRVPLLVQVGPTAPGERLPATTALKQVIPERKEGGPMAAFGVTTLAHRILEAAAEAAWDRDGASRVPRSPSR